MDILLAILEKKKHFPQYRIFKIYLFTSQTLAQSRYLLKSKIIFEDRKSVV